LKGTNQQGRDLNRGKFQYRQLAGAMQANLSLRTAQTVGKILAAEVRRRKHSSSGTRKISEQAPPLSPAS